MAMIPLCTIVHSRVAVLLPVGEARAMHLCILKTDGWKNAHTPFKSLQTSMSHKIDLLDLGSAIIRSAKSTKSNNIPDPNPMPIKDGLSGGTFGRVSCTTQLRGRTCEKKTKYAPLRLCSDISDSILIQQGRSNELDVQNEWEENTHTHTRGTGALRSSYLGPVLTMFGKSKSENQKLKINV